MALTLHNTLTLEKEPFTSIEQDKVKMYCCGITVYDYCHLGHARTCIVWDVVRRYLKWRGYDVTYIQNFTGIIAKELRKEGNLLVHQGKTETASDLLQQQWHTLRTLAHVLGLEADENQLQPEPSEGVDDAEIEALIEQRKEARKNKNFAESDRLQDHLNEKGIILVDQPVKVTTWQRG